MAADLESHTDAHDPASVQKYLFQTTEVRSSTDPSMPEVEMQVGTAGIVECYADSHWVMGVSAAAGSCAVAALDVADD